MTFFHAHTHSEFSVLDGMSDVPQLVAKAASMEQPGLALTDHGNMSGAVQLYKAGKEHNLSVFPGVEGYLLSEHNDWDAKAQRYHVGLLPLNLSGYKKLVKFVSMTYTRPRFSRFPRFDTSDLVSLACSDIALLTGCYFGLVQQTFVRTESIVRTQAIVAMYAKLFPYTFVEMQNHGITENDVTDEDMCDALYHIAKRLGLPTIITQDAHYAMPGHKVAHALMKRMVYGGQEDEFPGDSFHLASTDWVQQHHNKKHWRYAQDGFKELIELNELSIPPLDKFTSHIPQTATNPRRRVFLLCHKQLIQLGLSKDKRYTDRLKYELEVINHLGISDYFLLVRKIVKWCEDQQILVEARGSANGSLVCYLLGITQVDPIQWGNMFERFLSKDRTKPPDIDLDVEDISRRRVMDYISSHFKVKQIGTFANLGMDAEGKGSVLVTYMAHLRKQFEPDEFRQEVGYIKSVADVRGYNESDYQGLKKLAGMQVRRSYGVHAAGLLIGAPDLPIDEYVPSMLVASSDTTVTQFQGDDVEEMGFMKLDLLGQRTLTMMRRTQENIGRDDPRDFTWIPYDDKDTLRSLWTGRTDNGIFHFEGYTKAKGAREMRPRTTKELCLAQALFMPGAMDSGQTALYLKRRASSYERSQVSYIHPAWREALSDTHGTVIFQEQVIDIMRRLGMSIAAINVFFKVVKDSGKGATTRNAERLRKVRSEFEDHCRAAGIQDIDAAWSSTAGFVAYGFNQAHATGYGIRAYRCAYLKTHYPLEFMSALLETAGNPDREQAYTKEARECGLAILPPDVNKSGAYWTMDRRSNGIRRGLSSIRGVGEKAAQNIEDNAPYSNIDDFVSKTDNRIVSGAKAYLNDKNPYAANGVIKTLIEAGAMDSIGVPRLW